MADVFGRRRVHRTARSFNSRCRWMKARLRESGAIMKQDSAVVFVIDDDPSVRDALDSLIRSVALNVQSFATTEEFLLSKRPEAPGCIVLDVRLPVIFITGHGDVPMSVKAIKAGAIEFLTKPFRDQDLLDAIHVGIESNRLQREASAVAEKLRSRFVALTQREREIMRQVASGRPNKQIAAELKLSEFTVKVHRGHVMQKMKAKSLADLVRMADSLLSHTVKA